MVRIICPLALFSIVNALVIVTPVSTASAQLITGVTATATSELVQGPFNRPAMAAANGAGLDMAGVSHGTGEGTAWESDGIGEQFTDPDDRDPAITFDLGGLYLVDTMRVWNFSETQPAVRRADVQISLDGSLFTSIGERTFALAMNPFQDFAVGPVATRFVRLDILENGNGTMYPFPPPPGAPQVGFVGLAEVRFFGPLIPEPASILLLACGLLGVAGFRYGRRASVV
jgi:hypothetical protein